MQKSESEDKQQAKMKVIGIIILLLFILAAYNQRGNEPGTKPPRGNEAAGNSSKLDVSVMCEILVERKLKAPSTAKFAGGGYSRKITETATGYIYRSYVDAQNGFGAMIRSEFACSYDIKTDVISVLYIE